MISSPKKSHRQEAKERSRALKELHLLIQWEEKDEEDGESLYDVLPAKAIVDVDPVAVEVGQKCSATFQKQTYLATVVGKGTYSEMKKLQIAKEASADESMDVDSSEGTNHQSKVDAADDLTIAAPKSTTAESTVALKSTTPAAMKKQSPTRKKIAQKPKSSPRKRLISQKKSKPQAKRPNANVSADKAKSSESDRMSSLILASLEEPPSKSAKRSLVSSPKDESLREGSPKEGVPNVNKWSPNYGYDDTGLIDDDFYSVKSGITGGGSSYHSHSSLDNTPSGRSNSGIISPRSLSDFHCSSPASSTVFGDGYPPNYGGPSYSYPPFSPMPPYGMTHSQSWPPSDQGMCAQIMFALNSMKSDIQMLKTDMNVYKQKKRKRSREQSVAHSDISEPLTPGAVQIACSSPARAGVLLGDPYGDNLFVVHPTITRKDVGAIEALAKGDQKLALAMIDLFFPKDVQAASLVTKKEDRDLLDQNIIEGISIARIMGK